MALFSSLIQRGLRSAQPAATAVSIGALYCSSDDGLIERSTGSAWEAFGPLVRFVEVSLTSPQILALRATPITLVAAPGSGKKIQFLGADFYLDATATAYVESAANLGIKYTNGSGVQVCETIEATGFIDQTADTATSARPQLDPIVAKSGCENQLLCLHNLGAGEYTTGTGTLRVKVSYAVWTTGW